MYLLAGRQPASRWLNAEALRKSAPDAERSRRTLVSELRQTPPPVVVLGPHLDDPELLLAEYPQLASFLSECYAERPPGRDLADSSRDWKILLRTDRCQSSA
jgi:hypothetical protein